VSLVVSTARRSAVIALVAGLFLAVFVVTGGSQPQTRVAAQRLDSYTPVTGAIFNRPVGTSAEQRAIFTHVNRTIDATPPGATIRFAVFSFAEQATTDKLIAAYRRGVNVQLIFDDHVVYPQEARLRSVIGRDPNRRSFVVLCHKSCRGTGGNMHDKVFLFSQAGQASNVVMVGSNNMTRHNAVDQWSDIYTVVGDPALYFTYSGVFEQMKFDRPMTTPYIAADVNGYEPQFYPYPGVSQATDPLYQILSNVTCTGTTTETQTTSSGNTSEVEVPVTTSLRISQHAWNGERGKYLARKVAELEGAGCDIEVIYGVGMGASVKTILDRAGVPLSKGQVKGVRTHQKTLLLSGVYGGDPNARIVWTGSHNWSDGALRRDEIIFKVQGQAAYDQYLANFDDIWANG
jgi:hypothetical protein